MTLIDSEALSDWQKFI